MNDDLGNVETSYYHPTEPEDQKKERNEERAKVQGGKDLLLDLIKRWEDKANHYLTIDSIPADVRADGEKLVVALAINAGMRDEVRQELEYLDSLKRQYLK